MNVLFVAFLVASIILLTITAAPNNRAPAWTWYTGVVALILAAVTATLNG